MTWRRRSAAAAALLTVSAAAICWLARGQGNEVAEDGWSLLRDAASDPNEAFADASGERRPEPLERTPEPGAADVQGEPSVEQGYFAGFAADAVGPCRVHGRLVDPAGAPLAGATVRLAWSPWLRSLVIEQHRGAEPACDATVTDVDGRFDLRVQHLLRYGYNGRMLDFESMPACLVVVDPRCALTVSGDIRPIDEADVGTLVVKPGGSASGRVVDSEGRAVPDARVSTSVPDDVPESFASTRTGADGRFELPALAAGDGLIDVSAFGFASRRLEHLAVPAGGTLQLPDIELARDDPIVGAVRGRVLDEQGQPVAGARVAALWSDLWLRAPEGPWMFGLQRAFDESPPSSTAITDTMGRFAILGRDHGACALFAWAPDYSPDRLLDVHPGAGEVELRLPPEASVPLHLRDASGRPADADELHVLWLPSRAGDNCRDLPFRRLGPGVISLSTVRKGQVAVWASAPGCAVTGAQLSLPAEGALEFSFAPESVIEGHVVDDTGAPVPRACIELKHFDELAGSDRSVVAGEDGSFRATRLAAGSWQLRLLADAHVTTKPGDFMLAAGEHRTDVVYVLPRDGEVFGVVSNGDGVPVRPSIEWGLYDAVHFLREADGDRAEALVSSQGEFRIRGLGAGRWRMRLGELAEVEFELFAGGVTRADLVVPRWPVVRGHVRQAGGPARGACLNTRAAGRGEAGSGADAAPTSRPRCTRFDGSFILPVRGSGRFTVWASVAGGGRSPSVDLLLAPGDEAPLELELGTGCIKGRITCAEDGGPVQASVGIRGVMNAQSSDEGDFVLDGLLPGTYDVVAAVNHGAPAEVCGLRVADGETREGVEIVVHRPVTSRDD